MNRASIPFPLAELLGSVLRFSIFLLLTGAAFGSEVGFPGRNVNVVGPPPPGFGQPNDVGLRQQNEPSCAVNPANPQQICCGFNDYRGIDIPELGDAWEGLACTRDGGHRWNSLLISGSGADPEHNLNLGFAADPNLVSAPGGLFYNFIAANRDGSAGGIYLQRYAWRNKEDGWPLIQVGGPILVSKGTNGRFIDKPHMIGWLNDASNAMVTMDWTDANGFNSRTLPAGNLGMAAAVFVGNDNNDGTKILYWSSEDWGKTWNNPTKLSESKGVNSGINLAANGDNLCAVWRRFDDVNETNSILFSCSSNRGKRFTKPKVMHDICPYDQTTLNGVPPSPQDIVSFRTNAFPVLAGDGERFYAFWSDRGYAIDSGGVAGCNLLVDDGNGNPLFNASYGRIVYSVSSNNGKTWSSPLPVEDLPGLKAHQFMPAAFGANGDIVLAWIDNRDDITKNFPSFESPLDKQLIADLWNGEQGLYRHTADIRSTRFSGGELVGASVKVSRYTLAQLAPNTPLIQMEHNLVNARLFQQGTAPFIGDYLAMTANAYNKNSDGKWQNSNTVADAFAKPTFYIGWSDNRDVRGNAWGNGGDDGFTEPAPYTPTNPGSTNATLESGETNNMLPAVEDPPDAGQVFCEVTDPTRSDRSRDQNVYVAPLYPLVLMDSPGAIKIAQGVQRALPVFVQNLSGKNLYFKLDIEGQPSDFAGPDCTGLASFQQFPLPDNSCSVVPETSLWVEIHAKSSAVRTVFLTSAVEALPRVVAKVTVCGEIPNEPTAGLPDEANCATDPAAQIVLNQDPLEFGGNLEQPDFNSTDISTLELHNPDLLNPDLLNPQVINLILSNPDLLNPDLFNLNLFNPDLINPDLFNHTVFNPDLLNPELLNLLVANPDLLNLVVATPDLLNPDLLNLLVLNPDLLNPDLLNLLITNPDLLNLIVANPDLLNSELLNSLILNPDLLNPELLNSAVLNVVEANPDLLNPDLLNMMLANPDLLNPDLLNPDLLNQVLANPDLLNPDLLNAAVLNPDLLNPDLLNPDLLNALIANPDLLNPDLLNPDLLNPELLNVLLAEVLNPDLLNPDLLNPDLLNPDLLNPDLLNLMLLNPDLLNPDLLNPDLLNPDLLNPDLLNPDLLNLLIANPDLLNPDLLNPDLLNPNELNPDLLNTVVSYSNISNPDLLNGSLEGNEAYVDVTWQVQNDGNTTTGYMAQPFVAGTPDEHTSTQLIVSKPYLRQTTRNCLPVLVSDNHILVNIVNPPIGEPTIDPDPVTDPNVQGLASYWLGPGEVANVTLRIFNPDPLKLHPGRAGLYVSSEACNTGEECDLPFDITREVDFDGPVLDPDSLPDIPGVEATGSNGAVVEFDTITAIDAGDGGSVPVTCDIESGEFFPIGTTVNICRASDSVGNQSSLEFSVDIVDTTAPMISVNIPGGAATVEAENVGGTEVDFFSWVTVIDLVDPDPTLVCSPTSGSLLPVGVTTVSCRATDNGGYFSIVMFDITVRDTSAPTLTQPGDIIAEATSAAGAFVTYTDPAASDTVDPAPSVVCLPASGLFTLGNTLVTCTVTDASDNSAEVTFDVLVQDTTAPSILLIADFNVEATDPFGAIVEFTPVVSDLVDENPERVCAPASGSEFALGQTVVACSATDGEGNQSGIAFRVTVVDSTPPDLNQPTDITGIEATSPAGTAVNYPLPAAVDLVDTSPIVNCLPTSGTTFALGDTLVTCSAVDDFNNTSQVTFTVNVVDTTAPELTLPDDIVIPLTNADGAIVDFAVSATDTVDTEVAVVCAPSSGSLFPIGSTVVSCTATDDAGRETTGDFNVRVDIGIIWIEPVDDPHTDTIGPNLNLRWGYGFGVTLLESRFMIDKPPGRGTEPIMISRQGATCGSGEVPEVVNLDAGKSSLRYSSGEWQLNWQTGQSTLNETPLIEGCYLVEIPRSQDNGNSDTKRIILTN